MHKAKVADIDRILDYLRKDVGKCLYIYIDISIYGLDKDFLDVWFDEDEKGISFVIMRYHDAFQLYTDREEWDIDAVLSLAEEYDIQALHGKKDIIDTLGTRIGDDYSVHYGVVLKGGKPRSHGLGDEDRVEQARPEDADEIAALMCTDTFWSSVYDEKVLAAQLRERMETGMGRSFVIRDNGKIVVHDATFAETKDVVVVSGMMVHKDYRNTMLGGTMEYYMSKRMADEGKQVYFMIVEVKRAHLFEKLGNTIVTEYGKWVKDV